MKLISAIFIMLICISTSDNAHAKLIFGDTQEVRKIQPLKFAGYRNEKIFLGRLIKTKSFILGVDITDMGYVLGIEGSDSYYPLPTGQQLKSLQQAKLLPSPLPSYQLPLIDLAYGYSLQLMIMIIGAFGLSQQLKDKEASSHY